MTKPRLIALTAALIITDAAFAQSVTDKFPLKGVIRDFSKTNPNIATAPTGGNGTYSGNIAVDLGSDGRPVFTGAGYKVATPWLDAQSHVIAPNMYVDPNNVVTGGIIRLTSAASLSKQKGDFDTYNSTLGPYGGSNIGPAPTIEVGSAMPNVSIPAALSSLPNQGNMNFSGSNTVSANLRCNRLDGSGTIKIAGKVNILCEDVFALATHTVISLEPDATLTLYLMKGASSWNHAVVGDPLKPSRMKVYNLSSTGTFLIHNHAEIYAHLISPSAALEITNHGSMFGQFTGKTLNMLNHGNFHVDQAGGVAADACGVEFKDIAGTKGISSTAGIPNGAGFSQWYTDVLGVNLSAPHTITLVRNSANTQWQYINDAFWPIDKKLKGNESQAHNNYFTWTCSAMFVHHGCVDKFVEFTGKDDMWMFINGKLVMDRGGVVPTLTQHVDMDRLGLVDGEAYTLEIFYAQRNSAVSQFRLFTNLDLIEQLQQIVQISGPMD